MAIGLIPLIVAIGALVLGSILGYLTRQSIARRQADTAEAKIDKLISEAKAQAQEIILKAKDKAVKALDEIKKEEVRREEEFRRANQRLTRKEELLETKSASLDREENDLREKVEKVRTIKTELERLKEEEIKNLEQIAKLSQEEAKKEILKLVEEKNKEEIFAKIQKLEKFGKEELEKKAQDIMITCLQRYASSQAADITKTTISLSIDEIKGKIIGREERQ